MVHRHRRRTARIATVLCVTLSGASAALLAASGTRAQDDLRAQGETIARDWCSGCHLLPGGDAASDAAPALGPLMRGRDISPDALRSWLSSPHPRMPDLQLSRLDIEALVAYLQSLDD